MSVVTYNFLCVCACEDFDSSVVVISTSCSLIDNSSLSRCGLYFYNHYQTVISTRCTTSLTTLV